MKSILAILLIFIQLALQVGIPIHKHFCEMDGAFASVLLKIDHQCEDPHEELPSCCQEEQTAACEPNLQEKDCCSDELQVVKTNVDQAYSSFEIEFLPIYFSQKPVIDFSFFTTCQVNQTYNADQAYRPPPLYASSRDLQVKQQVWRI
ncbi:MAG: HYC_CC_PP family protein [Flavobacteriia bacterium]